MEKLLVCDALDERDFLAKKICKEISNMRFIKTKRKQDTNVSNMSVEEFTEKAKSSYQRVNDLIDRWNRLDVAITLSNANTFVTLRSGKSMSRTAAIALRRSYAEDSHIPNFRRDLLDAMSEQRDDALCTAKLYKSNAEKELETYKEKFISKDSTQTIADAAIEGLNKMVEGLYPEIVDPLNIQEKLDEMHEKYNNTLKELDSAIKVSNATTYVEF